ncbi:MAG: ABC transporter ATP-binding protein, partial [Methylococcaceae bacterium]|nr:ABC transporter ATP-binding protein [Methylococcaceae bacterium]
DAVKKAEAQMEKFHLEQQALEQQLADPVIYEDSNKEQLKQVLANKAKVDAALEQAELAWMTAEEQLQQQE